MVKQAPPEPGAIERQDRKQRRRSTRRKAEVYGLVATLMIVAGVLAACSSAGNDAQPGGSGPIPTPVPTSTATPIPTSGALEPGTYSFSTFVPDFDASHRITMSVPDGYEGGGGYVALKLDRTSQTGVSVWAVGDVYADPCDRVGSLLDPPAGSSVDGLVAALASQQGLRVSTPISVTVDGFPATYMERTVPAGTDIAGCHGGEFRVWLATDGGARYLDPGQQDLLWILDVDGVPLVIDAALEAGISAQDRAEIIRIAESVRIDPR